MVNNLDFTDVTKDNLAENRKTGNKPILDKMLKFFHELEEHTFVGTGNSEQLIITETEDIIPKVKNHPMMIDIQRNRLPVQRKIFYRR